MDLKQDTRGDYLLLATVVLTALLTQFPDIGEAQSTTNSLDYMNKKPVNVVLLIPRDPKYMFSYTHVNPALEIALEKVRANESLLPNHYLDVRFSDTQCNEAYGMNYAIEYFIAKQVDIFFGPVCDYVIAPILRQATFWNLPMITVGATAWDFVKYKHQMYPMLTRVGPINHISLVQFFLSQIKLYKWKKLKLLYEKKGQDQIVTDFCHFSNEVLFHELQSTPGMEEVSLAKVPLQDHGKFLMDEVGLDFGGEWFEYVSTPFLGR